MSIEPAAVYDDRAKPHAQRALSRQPPISDLGAARELLCDIGWLHIAALQLDGCDLCDPVVVAGQNEIAPPHLWINVQVAAVQIHQHSLIR